MHRFFCVPEVVARILEPIDQTGAFRLALTCKSLLEPSLDRVWRDIGSFEPLIACLPEDLWREELIPSPEYRSYNRILHLQRDLTADYLERYLTYYASRIRNFGLSISMGSPNEMPSIESLRALELFTEVQPGALSPRLKHFHWYDSSDVEEAFGEDIAKHLPPYMFLFLGRSVKNLEADFGWESGDKPILLRASVDLSLKRLRSSMTHLSISDGSRFNRCFSGVDRELLAIEHLNLTDAAIPIVPDLAVLPRLTRLNIFSFTYAEFAPPPPASAPVASAFKSLRQVVANSHRTSDVEHFLRHIPPCNALQSLDWLGWPQTSSRQDFQATLDALAKYCNPRALTDVVLGEDMTLSKEVAEDVESEDTGQIDLTPLYAFKNIECLRLNVCHSVLLTPDILATVPTTWPRLHSLVLCQDHSSSHVPLVNHEHLLQLVLSLPSLCELGIQFDATRIPETVAEAELGRVSRLRTLKVGGSPICSPARTVAFLQTHFPYLDKLHIGYNILPEEGKLFVKRWEAVHDQWKTFTVGI